MADRAPERLLIIIPVYGKFDFAAKAARSALAASHPHTETYVLVLDDASPGGEDDYAEHIRPLEFAYQGRVFGERLRENLGLTRVWNQGLRFARKQKFDYACCTNSDVIFANNWFFGVESALRFGAALAGPLTNAPGAKAAQDIRRHAAYELTDASDHQERVDSVGASLFERYNFATEKTLINGFCMTAKTKTWWRGAYAEVGSRHNVALDARTSSSRHYAHETGLDNVFRPANPFNSKGQPNPTPRMTLNEDELQGRWQKLKMHSVLCLGSFVFHYRAITRGDAHKTKGAFRPR